MRVSKAKRGIGAVERVVGDPGHPRSADPDLRDLRVDRWQPGQEAHPLVVLPDHVERVLEMPQPDLEVDQLLREQPVLTLRDARRRHADGTDEDANPDCRHDPDEGSEARGNAQRTLGERERAGRVAPMGNDE
jgi:hypothetical protein